jgi:hypothetical protein
MCKEKEMEGEPEALKAQPQVSDRSGPKPLLLLGVVVFVALVTFLLTKGLAGKHSLGFSPRLLLALIAAFVLFLRLLPILFDKTFGAIGLVQIFSPEFEQRIRTRYQSETALLAGLGFDLLFFVGDSMSVFRLALIFPAIVVLHMRRNRVPMTFSGPRLLTGNPVFIFKDKTAYAHPNSLGFTFHTLFQDGTLLVSKNFGDDSGFISSIVVNICSAANASDTWAAHQKRRSELEAQGKRVDRQNSFETYREIVLKEQTRK